MKLYLHIGTFKTGSTALQSFFSVNREILQNYGVYWGDYSHLSGSHSNLAYGLLRNALKKEGQFEQYSTHVRFQRLAEEPAYVIKKILHNSQGCHSVILSNEALFSDAFRTLIGLQHTVSQELLDTIHSDMLDELKALTKDAFDETIIICYLRRQDLFIESQYNQYCKHPWAGSQQFVSFAEFVQHHPITLDYYRILERWMQHWPMNTFLVRPYTRHINIGIIPDFVQHILGLSIDDKWTDIPKDKANLRWPRDLIEYKNILHINLPNLEQVLEKFADRYEKRSDYAYFTFSERQSFLQQFESSNHATIRLFPAVASSLLDNNLHVPQYPGINLVTFADITRYLLANMANTKIK